MQCCAIWCIGPVSSASLHCDETAGTFAGPSECGLETADTFARGKCGFPVCCGVAVVMAVSLVSSVRRALVPSVSPASWAAVAAVVAALCGRRERCRKWLDGFNPAKLLRRVSEKMRRAPLFQ